MFNKIKSKHIFFLPVIITAIGAFILYGFLLQNINDIYSIVKTAISTGKFIVPASFNLKYLILFSGLILMSLTDMLFERISTIIPILLIIAGFIFAYLAHLPLLTVLESIGIGLGIFIFMDITKLGSYAAGDILTAGAIGVYVGIENIVIISISAIILGKIITFAMAKIDGVCDKSQFKEFNMAFVPVLFLVTAVIKIIR
ncbi:MAG: prepilin peptidase [bacterium]